MVDQRLATSTLQATWGVRQPVSRGWNPVLGRLRGRRSSWVGEPHGAAVEQQQEEHVVDATMASNQYAGGFFRKQKIAGLRKCAS